ncbi:MAG: Lrp/AsnC family transcriptional regulator [Candidatus Hadarchaeota archaeon]
MTNGDIDELDRKIISVLSQDSSISYSKLADEVDTSRNTAYRRVKKLREKGILLEEPKGGKIVDVRKLERLGISTILIQINVEAKDVEEAGKILEGLEEVKMLMESYGRYDFIVLLMLESGEEREYLRDLRSRLAEQSIEVNKISTSQITTLNKIDFSMPEP